MVLRYHSLWSVKMFLDLWNFWCLILASKVLLALTVQQLHLPTRAATLRVSLLPKCLANNISFSVKHVHQEVKSRSWDLVKCSRLKCIVQWCRHAYCVSLFSAFIELSCTASCCHGRRSASSPNLSLHKVSVLRLCGRGGLGCVQADGDIRAVFHFLASSITLSALVSKLG